ncbi:MAG: NAD(P)-dependent alcohol dehydrogenase [Chloroflexi bacterium]|nr:NAD(P)-dependent alcohol dehydrogenase [Chloroflexota bacterium]
MKAIVATRYGRADGLQLKDVPTPTPQSDEVLVRVHAATVTAGDVMLRKTGGTPLFWPIVRDLIGMPPRKRTPGHEFAGVVEAVGANVTRFKPGDAVFGTTTGLTVGANAEYVCVPESHSKSVLAIKPEALSFEQAAAVPVGAMTALFLLRHAAVEAGNAVLIYGASGSVGTYAVQIAKALGADVTGVASTGNVELVRSLGAGRVIDYTQEDFAAAGPIYDVVFDAVGKAPVDKAKSILKPGGRFTSIRTLTHESDDALAFLRGLIDAGQLVPVIDRRYPLEQTADAHRYAETGRKKGNVVITVASDSSLT